MKNRPLPCGYHRIRTNRPVSRLAPMHRTRFATSGHGQSNRVKRGLLSALLVAAIASQASSQVFERASVATWATTTFYLGFAEFADAVDGRIRVAAADRYSLYLNGELLGTDDDPGSVEVYEVSFKKRTNMVAAAVEHDGASGGYGLFVVLEAEGVLLPSSPTDRLTPWFWTDFPLENQDGAAWTQLRLNKLGGHTEDLDGKEVAVTWRAVQAGSLDPGGYDEFADLDLTRAQSVAGFPGGLDGSRGSLRLRSFGGQNLAFNTFSKDLKLIDGDINSPVSYAKGGRVLFDEVEVDLGRLFPINRVKVITQPPGSSGSYEDNSLRGYSVLVSKDGVNYLDVGSRNQITDFRETAVDFPTIIARYVRMVVTEFANRNAAPRVGELEVFGTGFDERGTYLSPPLDFGVPERKNFDRAVRFESVAGTSETAVQFRSGDDGENWSGWSAWNPDPVTRLTVPEPRRFLQFRLRMRTPDPFVSPQLDSLVFFYNRGPLAATDAVASIAPSLVSIGVDSTFTYSLDLEIGDDDAGVQRLVILTPWPAQLDIPAVSGDVGIDAAGTYATADSLIIAFDPPISASLELEIPFTTRLLAASHQFQGLLYAPDSNSPLSVQQREGVDPLTGEPFTVVSAATSFALSILSDVRPFPAVFSPNEDGINDRFSLGFILGRVSDAPVQVGIHDLGGSLVRTLPEQRLDAGYYAPGPGGRTQLPFSWDGRDQSGELLPPGLYLYRLVVDIEPDAETAAGLVGMVY